VLQYSDINGKTVTILFYLLVVHLTVYNRTITRFIADDKVVYQRVRWEIRLASDNSWARHHLKHVSWRSPWIIFLCTLEQRMAVSCEISWAHRCLFGLSSWLSTRSSTATRRTQSNTAWLGALYPSCGFSSADCRCQPLSGNSLNTLRAPYCFDR